ncbi:MAG: hypothetical protein IT233_06535 [Bacteroidia bacterium]|nr:hypothetical protein [Bacteroidia bacterium]
MKTAVFRLLPVLLLPFLLSMHRHKYTEYYVMFYNTENFFDTIDDPHKSDNDFLPDAKRKWNTGKYFKKINRLAEVIDSVPGDLPDLIGLCEVEEKSCLEDLVRNSRLIKGNYSMLISSGPDVRGIETALLFDQGVFKLQSHQFISATNPQMPENKTRDILYAHLKYGQESIHVFVIHFPSRIGGEEKTEVKRIFAAGRLRKKIDSIQYVTANAKILVMGDFNDLPDNKSLTEVLHAHPRPTGSAELMNVTASGNPGDGTYLFKEQWNLFDQMLVSSSFKGGPHQISCDLKSGNIYKKDFLLKKGKEGKVSMYKTFNGTKYLGGYSDHLPVYLKLFIN